MPLYIALGVLAAINVLLFALAAALGMTLDGREAMTTHFLVGLLTSIYTCFLHVLVLFYFIGTGKDIREAVAEDQKLRARYVPWTRDAKRRVFPAACLALGLMIFATLMGGEVHSRVLAHDGGETLPFRGVPAWWVHLASVVGAVLSSLYAFWIEIETARENRRAIEDINQVLAARSGSPG